MIKDAYIRKYNLDGYIANGKPVVKKYLEKYYSIQKFQGEHEGEYTVMEVDENGVENGKAQLFKRGVLQLSWMMKSGMREGELTVYRKGVVDRVLRWDDLYDVDQHRDNYCLKAVVNAENGKELLEEMIVGSGVVVYRGEFNSKTHEREGFGIEYDKESGVEKRSGYYRNDELVHLCQEFEEVVNEEDGSSSTMEMTEYSGGKDENNVDDCLDYCPIYIGGYAFDAKRFRFIRSGKGNIINKLSGMCDWVGEWDEKGEMKEGSDNELHGGWYGEGRNDGSDESQSIRISQLEKNEEEDAEEKREEEEKRRREEDIHKREALITNFTEQGQEYRITIRSEDDVVVTLSDSVEELNIDDNCFNESCSGISKLKLDFSGQSTIKRIEIGNKCFKHIREFVLNGLKSLESVKIGEDCFKISSNERNDGFCQIANCPKLRQLEIGNYCFQDFKSFELFNVNSLQSIKFDNSCFQYADFSLKSR